MSNEGSNVHEQVRQLAFDLAHKINDANAGPKMVIGFTIGMLHADGTIATDLIGYMDMDKMRSRIDMMLGMLAHRNYAKFSDVCFTKEDGTIKTNEEARPALWQGF